MNEETPTRQEQQLLIQQQQFSIKLNGDVEFKGEITEQNKDVIYTLLGQAEYCKQKTVELEKEKLKSKNEIDTVIIIFVASVLSMVMFAGYALANVLIQNLNQSQPTTGQQNNGNLIG